MMLEAKCAFFSHFAEEAVESYAFGRLPLDELASFEEHLLHCEHCQQRLEAEDNFVEAMHVLAGMDEPLVFTGVGNLQGKEGRKIPKNARGYSADAMYYIL